MATVENWYIVKQPNGQCEIVTTDPRSTLCDREIWGPYPSQREAIARRVGLIRAGKCQPA